MNQKSDNKIEMPKYVCHKAVHALQIKQVLFDYEVANRENRDTDGSARLIPYDERYGPIRVDVAFVHKHSPFPDGYYVVYKDGYKSFSPKGAFEEGYGLMEGGS